MAIKTSQVYDKNGDERHFQFRKQTIVRKTTALYAKQRNMEVSLVGVYMAQNGY